MNILEKMNKSMETRHPATLNEAVPRDLMQQIRKTRNFDRRENTSDTIYNDWNPSTRQWDKKVTGVRDYANASYQELTPQEVLAMKKRGEDLSNIYVLDDRGKMLKLANSGNPDDSAYSTKEVRSNQALKTTLANASKIYKMDVKDLIDSDPDKVARLSNDEIRNANYNLGHKRGDYWHPRRKDSDYVKKKRAQSGNSAEIAAIKTAYEEGDISRKEMERQIAEIRNDWRSTPGKWDIEKYNDTRNRNAESRYKASELELQKPFRDLKDARRDLKNAEYDLSSAKAMLQNVKSGNNSGYGSDYLSAKAEVERLTQQIASLQKSLAYYQSKIDNGAQDADIQKYETEIANSTAKAADAKARINKLLRRTEALAKKSNKKLDETYDAFFINDAHYEDPVKQELADYFNDRIYDALDNIFIAAGGDVKNLPEPSERYTDGTGTSPSTRVITKLVQALVAEYYGDDINESLKKKSGKKLNEEWVTNIKQASPEDQYKINTIISSVEDTFDNLSEWGWVTGGYYDPNERRLYVYMDGDDNEVHVPSHVSMIVRESEYGKWAHIRPNHRGTAEFLIDEVPVKVPANESLKKKSNSNTRRK